MLRIYLAALIGLLVLFSWGCSNAPETADEQLRQTISEAESSIQAHDLSQAMSYVHPDYQDRHGLDLRQLRAMLAGYFLRHQSLYILSDIEKIEVMQEDEAKVLLFVGVAGSPQQSASSLGQWRGDLLRLDLRFIKQGDEWRVRQADWRRATPEDFIH